MVPGSPGPRPHCGLSPEPQDPFLSPFSARDVPKGAETFGVSESSGVRVFVVYDPEQVTVPTGQARWPLDASVGVTVSVDTASKDLNDLKVRGHFPTVRGCMSPPLHHPR